VVVALRKGIAILFHLREGINKKSHCEIARKTGVILQRLQKTFEFLVTFMPIYYENKDECTFFSGENP
jgi:hypothetical protein